MIGLALRGLGQRKLRSALTAIAVLLGVAMIAGTYVLTDQMRSGFSELADADLRRSRRGGRPEGRRSRASSAPASRSSERLVDDRSVRVPGVAKAEGDALGRRRARRSTAS